MREKEANRKTVGSGTAALGGLMIAALAFSAGFVGARSHRPAGPRASEAVVQATTSVAQGVEPLSIRSDLESSEHRMPGHSELDLQLD
jgi:hypothetical protein